MKAATHRRRRQQADADERVPLNPGCAARCGECVECTSALPYGASCAVCASNEACRTQYAIRGSEGSCRFSPSQFAPNVAGCSAQCRCRGGSGFYSVAV